MFRKGINHKSINNPNFGNKWTIEQKRKQSKLTKIKMQNTNMVQILEKRNTKGKNNGFYGKYHTEKFKKEQSERNKGQNNPSFGKVPSNGKRFWYKDNCFRSSWEYLYAKWLDKNKIKWSYEVKTFNLGQLTYTPDFYLSEKDLYIEIKGYWRNNAKRKFELFKELYPDKNINLLVEKNLIKLGVLK